MPREVTLKVPTDTCMFTPFQLQPATALRLGMNCGTHNAAEHFMPMHELIQQRDTGFVVIGAEIEYLDRFDFFSSSVFDVSASHALHNDATLLHTTCVMKDAEQPIANVKITSRFLKISSKAGLDAAPTTIDGDLLDRFQDDEIGTERLKPTGKGLIQDLEERAELLGEHTHKFTVGRDDCELADQWQFILLPTLIGPSREELIRSGSDKRLKLGFKAPMKTWQGEWMRPLYFGANAEVKTRAYWQEEEQKLTFVHKVSEVLPSQLTEEERPLCAIAIESFIN